MANEQQLTAKSRKFFRDLGQCLGSFAIATDIRLIRLEADLARRDVTPRKAGAGQAGKVLPLKLLRVEAGRRKGILLVFDGEGGERSWLLEQTSVAELLALLLRGRMRKGRRIELDSAELAIEPPAAAADNPLLCIAMGPLELCASLDRAAAKAMKTDLDRAMKRSG